MQQERLTDQANEKLEKVQQIALSDSNKYEGRIQRLETVAQTALLVHKRSMIVRGKQLYIRRTYKRQARKDSDKDWNMKEAYYKWDEYIDDADEAEVSALTYLWTYICEMPKAHDDILSGRRGQQACICLAEG